MDLNSRPRHQGLKLQVTGSVTGLDSRVQSLGSMSPGKSSHRFGNRFEFEVSEFFCGQ